MTSEERVLTHRALPPEKVASRHRERLAIVYVRQSTSQQIERDQESTRLEFRLAKARRGKLNRAVPMGYVCRANGEVILGPDE
jgi:hypothetical protein